MRKLILACLIGCAMLTYHFWTVSCPYLAITFGGLTFDCAIGLVQCGKC